MSKEYKYKVGDTVEVFEDVLTQHIHEGVAKIVKIHKQSNGVVDCDVKFYIDIHGDNPKALEDDAVRRQVKCFKGKYATMEEILG